MRRCAESEEAHAIARLDAGDAQAAEADNAGAQQGGGMQIVKTRGQGEHEIRSCQGKLGEPAIDRVAREGGRIAEVFESPGAVRAGSVDAADPRNAHA